MRFQIGNQIIDISGPGNLFKILVTALFVLVAAAALFNSYYTVQPAEEAVVTRFGAVMKTAKPGLHFLVPFVDKYEKVAVKQQKSMKFGFASEPAPKSRSYRNESRESQAAEERNMVTGDLNSAQVEWVIQYRVSDAEKYLYKVRNPDDTLRAASESVMREVVGDRTVDEVITIGRQEMENEFKQKLFALVNAYELGVTIDQVQLNNVQPPAEVKASFNEVNAAQQEKQRDINLAHKERNSQVPAAGGEAEKTVSAAEGYASKRVNEAEGNVAKFVALFEEYKKSPEITKRRIYLETMEKVLPQLGKKVIIDEKTNQVLPLLPLDGSAMGGN